MSVIALIENWLKGRAAFEDQRMTPLTEQQIIDFCEMAYQKDPRTAIAAASNWLNRQSQKKTIAGRTVEIRTPSAKSFDRAMSLLNKEPDTIAWLDSFDPTDVLWDIGANVGVYTLYAAAVRECKVCAFEPGAANYFGLNMNIMSNGLEDKVQAYCLSIGAKQTTETLYLQDPSIGGALHNVGEAVDYRGQQFVPSFRQGTLQSTLDDLVKEHPLPHPTHIKVDVDGLEKEIIAGGQQMLSDPRLRSVLVEACLDDREEVEFLVSKLDAAGLHLDHSISCNAPRLCKGVRIQNMIFCRG